MEIETLVIFSLACLALTATPGPDMLLIAARSVAQGRLAGLFTYLGVATGSFIHASALALGLSQLFLTVPYAYEAVRYAGALYLAYLAWQAFTSRGSFSAHGQTDKKRSMLVIFRQGMVSNLLNPKVALFFLALFPQFIDPTAGAVGGQILALALILNTVGFVVNMTVVLLADSISMASSNARSFGKWSRYCLGTVFGGLAAKLIFDGGR
jgi:threonine/homoserine/homoserine lactone efflux protein